eukprot:521679_1
MITEELWEISDGKLTKDNNKDNRTEYEMITEELSKISDGKLTKDIKEQSIKSKEVIILFPYNDRLQKGCKLFLFPVQFVSTKELNHMIVDNEFYSECRWVSFSELLKFIGTVRNPINFKFQIVDPKEVNDINNNSCVVGLGGSILASAIRNSQPNTLGRFFGKLIGTNSLSQDKLLIFGYYRNMMKQNNNIYIDIDIIQICVLYYCRSIIVT